MNSELLASCRSQAEIAQIVGREASKLGFQYWSYMARGAQGGASASHWWLKDMPADLVQAYERRMTHVVPPMWLVEGIPERIDGGGPVDQLHDAMRRNGVTGGLCVPLHDTSGLFAALTLISCRSLRMETLTARQPQAQALAQQVHEACRPHVERAARSAAARGRLSEREQECLTWASRGKTAAEIGALLQISEHTVVYHFRRACSKLGATNRQQAVAKAIQLGYVSA